jgi:hypothetical protein
VRQLGKKAGVEFTNGKRSGVRLRPMMWRDLGYGFREAFTDTDEQLQRWVTQFQHDIGEPETGVLTVAQMETLTKRSEAVKISDVTAGLPLGDKDDGPEIEYRRHLDGPL